MPDGTTGTDEALEHALWWVARWVSGSMRDPDWSWPEAEAMSPREAFATVRARIGNALSLEGPFWRYLDLDEAEAARIEAGGELRPHARSSFQSFTGSYRLAREFGEESGRADRVGMAVRVEVPGGNVMFGMADLLADPRAKDTVETLDLWHHQGEVLVLVDAPLRVLEARRIDRDAEPPGPEEDEAASFRM